MTLNRPQQHDTSPPGTPFLVNMMFVAAIAVLGGCASTPPPTTTANVSSPQRFEALRTVAEPTGMPSITEWWRAYDSPTLDHLIEAGLVANRDLVTAVARVREARGVARALDASRLPSLDLVVNRDRQKSLVFPDGFIDRREIGLSLSWEPDVFGRLAQRAGASEALVSASEAEAEAVRSLLRNDIARAWLELRNAREQRRLSELVVTIRKDAVRAADTLFQTGQAVPQQQHEARMALEDALSRSTQWESDYRERLYLLWRLAGGSMDVSAIDSMIETEAQRPLGALGFPEALPSQVLEKRPDVQRAVHAVQAAAAGTKAARYDLLPGFRIALTPLYQNISMTSFDRARGEIFVAGFGLRLPVFDRKRLHAEVEIADARLAQAISQYEQAILQALGEVETTAATLMRLRRQLTHAEQAVRHTEERMRAVSRLFDTGLASYNETLEARQEWIQRRETAVEVVTSVRLGEIALARALGG